LSETVAAPFETKKNTLNQRNKIGRFNDAVVFHTQFQSMRGGFDVIFSLVSNQEPQDEKMKKK
jgi:hypothetical protein